MTLPELTELAKQNPKELVQLKTVAKLCGYENKDYKLFLQTYVYNNPRIEVTEIEGKRPRLYTTAKEAMEFIPAYIRFKGKV